ncbi:MAG TPA: DEAD/DEAH box helicase family protein [Bryobacteraceae bacterium]|nr:DEAD/DEAH box helicase family protein [Bryobacteraceae bacterium]
MPDAPIENPVINSPFEEPRRHFFSTEKGITSKIIESRRVSSYFVPVPPPRKSKSAVQLSLEMEGAPSRREENKFINDIRLAVAKWRLSRYSGTTRVTQDLLAYWQRPDRERRLFFCQIEALETAIYFAELSAKHAPWIRADLKKANDMANPLLNRVAVKMATGSGKTVVMAMLIVWQTLNKLADPASADFTADFLIVTPGITIRDRLRVLFPNEPDNYYRALDLVPEHQRRELEKARIVITNFHAFKLHERGEASANTKELLGAKKTGAFRETRARMALRVCRGLVKSKGGILVINDEAHHCYRPKPKDETGGLKLSADERREADQSNVRAALWISGIEAVKRKFRLNAVYDLSATPFFLNGSGYKANELFPWVVSDFSLIDAIESGIVKIPRVPVSDNNLIGDQPTYRDLWLRIRDELPRKGRATEKIAEEPKLPVELEGALDSLYSNYKESYEIWQESAANLKGQTPPVFIVVCNNTNVSRMLFNHIAGWEKTLANGEKLPVAGKLALFNNVVDGQWSDRPNTILVDSTELESGEAMSDEFRRAAALEIDEFKSEYRRRYPERDASKITDEDLLREVLNTVGKAGKLGEQIKCVVSVSMLTEGWDANTVTHILGVRAFGTQLLCEQVVGRGLRRRSFALDEQGHFYPEYAEVYGVPFSFIPSAGSTAAPPPQVPLTRVRAVPDRKHAEITFPRLQGYKYDLPHEKWSYRFDDESRMVLSTETVPTETLNAGILGATSEHRIEEIKSTRLQAIDFRLAQHVLETFFRDDEGSTRHWLFPQIFEICRAWRDQCLTCKDDMFPQLLLWSQFRAEAAEKIYRSLHNSTCGEKKIKPILFPYDVEGSTHYVDFDTARPTWPTDERFCHINYVVADTGSWEQKVAQTLESLRACYFKNDLRVGFKIPYTFEGEHGNYVPDFVARLTDVDRGDLHLIVEVTGEKKADKSAKVATARNLWVPAVNNDGRFGRWAFLELRDPWNAKTEISEFLAAENLNVR